MTGHYIVCGMGHLGYRIADLLLRLGEGVAVITEGSREDWVGDVEARGARIVRGDARSAARLRDAGIDGARALIAAIKLDMTNVEIAVEARQLRPELRVVLRLFDQQLARQLEKAFGIRGLGMSALAAPAFAAAAAGEHQIATFALGGQAFAIFSLELTAESPLRGSSVRDLEERHHAAVLDVDGHEPEGPPPRLRLEPVARLTLLARREDWLALRGKPPAGAAVPRSPRRRVGPRRSWILVRDAWRNAPLLLRSLFVVFNALIALSVFVFRFGMNLSFVDAVYFLITTVTTVGYGDYNLRESGPALKLYGALVMLLGSATIATLYSILTDFVVSTRFEQLAGRRRLPDGEPIVVVGLGSVGFRVVEELRRANAPAVVVERDPDGPYVRAAGAHVAVVLGDGRFEETLERAGVARAHAVVAVTGDDAANLGIALAVREVNPRARAVVRIFDADFAAKVQTSLGLSAALSASLTAAPTFVAAALSPGVLSAVVHDRRFLMLARQEVSPDLAGRRPSEIRAERNVRIVLRPQAPDGAYVVTSGDAALVAGEQVVTLTLRALG